MRNRQRGFNLGLLLLVSQVFQLGTDNIPPVTLAVLGMNVYLFLFPLKPLLQTCVSVQKTLWGGDWHRLLFSPFHHVDDWHLYFNMVSFLWKGISLERRLGTAWFAYLLSVFSLLTGLVYLFLQAGLTNLTDDDSFSVHCAVGFSGVLFALKVVNNYYNPGGVKYIMGIPVNKRYACWVELVLIHILSPGTSFVGHLSGILGGLLYTSGPLRTLMKACAGYSGYRTPYTSNRPHYDGPYDRTEPYRDLYTAGMSEQEQYEAAIRASLQDQEQLFRTCSRPMYGVNATSEASMEEIRQRRLRRFDS